MNTITKTAFIAVFLISGVILGQLFANENASNNVFHWARSSGNWEIDGSYLKETRGWTAPWGYYELLEHNTLISQNEFENFQKIEFTLQLSKPQKSKFDSTISFGVRSPQQSWFYYSYGIRFHGEKKLFGSNKINKVSLVQTSMRDPKLPPNQKGNSQVIEIASSKCNIPINKEHNYTILFEGDTLKLLWNGQTILTTQIDKSALKGRMAVSGRNAFLRLNYFKIIGPNDRVIFADNFEKDTIFRRTVEAKIETVER